MGHDAQEPQTPYMLRGTGQKTGGTEMHDKHTVGIAAIFRGLGGHPHVLRYASNPRVQSFLFVPTVFGTASREKKKRKKGERVQGKEDGQGRRTRKGKRKRKKEKGKRRKERGERKKEKGKKREKGKGKKGKGKGEKGKGKREKGKGKMVNG